MSPLSIPLRIAARLLAPVLFVLSLIVLYRGHHLPGGGFIGGLLAASGVGLVLLGCGLEAARRALRFRPERLVAVGLLVGAGSGLIAPIVSGDGFLHGVWLPEFHVPVLGAVHLGTPLLFDVGVYLCVIGFVLMCLFALVETDREPVEREVR